MASSPAKLGLALGAVGVLLGAAIAFSSAAPPAGPALDGNQLAQSLDGKLREAAAGLHARVTTLADLPRLPSAVSSDTGTVRDLTREELSFTPKPGELITIGQVPKGGGKPTVLLTLPEGASDPVALGQAGARLVLVGGKLALAEVVRVTPKYRADELTGALAVTWPVDVSAIERELAQAGASLRVTLPTGELTLGRPIAQGATLTALALPSPVAHEATVQAALPAGPTAPPPLRPIGLGIAALSILLGVVLARTGRAQPIEPPPSLKAPPPVDPTGKTAAQADDVARIGRYEIIRALGSGGMADVFLARSTGEAGFEKLIALKVLHRWIAQKPALVESFLDEARLASRLTHPNIVQIADLGRAGDEYFIAMEYIEGADLDRLLKICRERGEQVPLKVALHIVRKLCDGLHAAHTATGADGKPLELVHRDVKSANVFVARNGAVKVGDFGIAKAYAEASPGIKKTEAGMVKGTAAYMAPEHRSGQVIDRRADLYAVGAIAYEVLTGVEVDLDLAKLIGKGRDGWPHLPRPSEVRPDLPPALDALVLRCLAFEKEDRWNDCAVFEEALEKIAVESGHVAGEKVVAQWVEAALASSAADPGGAAAS